jgi:hypothetical protein
MIHSKVWENEKYRIEIDGDRVYATEKETGMNLANTIRIGDTEQTMEMMKKIIVFHELGNPTEDVLWENERYKLKFSWGRRDIELVSKGEQHTLASFSLKSVEVFDVIKKMVAFL